MPQKCDETKPTCLNCTLKGYKCDGYGPAPPKAVNDGGGLNQQLSTYATFTPDELRRFEFFCRYTSIELGSTFGHDFWTRLVPKAALNEPAISFSLLAVSSLHEYYSEKTVIHPDRTVTANDIRLSNALWNYSKAIRCILSANEQTTSKDRILTSCLLFTTFELIRGHQVSAMSHARSGLKVIGEYRKRLEEGPWRDTSELISMSELEDRFLRFDLQAKNDGGTGDLRNGCGMRDPNMMVPERFSSLVEARNSLLYQMNFYFYHCKAYSQLSSSPEIELPTGFDQQVSAVYNFVLERARAWKLAFEACCKQNISEHQLFDLRSQVLRVYHDYFLTLIETRATEGEMGYDCLETRFESMVERAERVLEHSDLLAKHCKRLPIVSVDIGLGEPMFCVAAKCRHPLIRRRALAVLESRPHFEGVFDNKSAAQGARNVIMFEEQGIERIESSQDIPEEVRIAGVVQTGAPGDATSAVLSYVGTNDRVLLQCNADISGPQKRYAEFAEQNSRFNLLGCSRRPKPEANQHPFASA